MYYSPFRQTKIILLSLLLVLLAGSGCIAAVKNDAVLLAEYQQKVSGIMDKWTVFRWGMDNLAWLVHYPEELVDPYVQLETARRKLKPQQAEEYRKAFIGELRIGSATAFMLSVHVFGNEPIKLAPISNTVLLVDSSGRGIKPISYEKKLDAPMIGLVQGFIFFKKQESQNLKVLIKGLIPGATTPFVFQKTGGGSAVFGEIPIKTGAPMQEEKKKKKTGLNSSNKKQEVLIKIPVITEPVKPQILPPKTDQPKKAIPPDPSLKQPQNIKEDERSKDVSGDLDARMPRFLMRRSA